MKIKNIPVQLISQAFEYHEGGRLIWKHRPVSHFRSKRAAAQWNAKYPGKFASQKSRSDRRYLYVDVTFVGEHHAFSVHRVVFALHNGYWPPEVDHVDRDGLNKQNKARSGVSGVKWEEKRRRWRVRIAAGGKKHDIGRFKTLEEAAAAAAAARARLRPLAPAPIKRDILYV